VKTNKAGTLELTPFALLRAPLLALLLTLVAAVAWPDLTAFLGLPKDRPSSEVLRIIAQSSVWLASAMLAIRLLDVLVWKGVVLRRTGSPAPRLLSDLVAYLVMVFAITAIIALVLDKPVTGLIATSSVAVMVIGLALKSLISDLFSGIALTLDHPFRMGDWIEIHGGMVGKVLNLTWRATGIILESGVYVVVPNSRLSEMVFRVYDQPEMPWRDEIDITLDYSVSAYHAERVLLSAAIGVPEVTAQARPPDVRIAAFGDNGTTWRLRFWVPDYPSRSRIRFEVQRNILRNLHYAGFSAAAPRVRNILHEEDAIKASADLSVEAFLTRVVIFNILTFDEIAQLASNANRRLFLKGATVTLCDEEGDSLFTIKEGLFDVSIPQENGDELIVARLGPGSFFGEMSLLTGAPRAATVRATIDSITIEITKDALQPILTHRESLMEALSNVLAERQLANSKAIAEVMTAEDVQAAQQTLAEQLLGRMRSFFGMK
jgi:small-conductance mechanosensitive channel/CRP-like cAMP-binding protein